MRAQGGGSIVLVASINGERGKFGLSAYAASKAGLIGLAKTMARESGRFGIRVNTVSPGYIETAMTADWPAPVKQAATDESCQARSARSARRLSGSAWALEIAPASQIGTQRSW